MAKEPDEYDEKEVQNRLEAALRGALKTPHQPLKEKAKAKKQRRSPATAGRLGGEASMKRPRLIIVMRIARLFRVPVDVHQRFFMSS
jgi:hypothetical protein